MQSIVNWLYKLRSGHSANPADGAYAMDAVNWLVHGKHGDAPECACPVISAYVILGKDDMPDDVRQRFLPYLHRIAGSRSAKHEAARARILWLAAIRVFAPRALESAGLSNEAARLRALPNNTTAKTAWVASEAAASMAAMAAAAEAAEAASVAAAWDDYFSVLDAALNAGPQGEPWSADAIRAGVREFEAAIS